MRRHHQFGLSQAEDISKRTLDPRIGRDAALEGDRQLQVTSVYQVGPELAHHGVAETRHDVR